MTKEVGEECDRIGLSLNKRSRQVISFVNAVGHSLESQSSIKRADLGRTCARCSMSQGQSVTKMLLSRPDVNLWFGG